MTQDGYEPILKNSRWPLLKNRENLTDRQSEKLSDLLQYNLALQEFVWVDLRLFGRRYGVSCLL